MKKTIWQKICQICPLCRYSRLGKNKSRIYPLLKKIGNNCPICRRAKFSVKEKNNTYFEKRFSVQPLLYFKQTLPSTPVFRDSKFEVINYCKKILSTAERLDELKKLKTQENKKIIGTFCNFVPEELVYAAGCIPVRLCSGCYETISPAEEVLPRDICPLIKSSFGFKIIQQSYFSVCDIIVMPTTCDGKKKLAEILNDYLPVWILELPQSKKLGSLDLWLKEIKKLKQQLEKFTGSKISHKKLKESVVKLQKRNSVFRQLYNIKKQNPSIISFMDYMTAIQASFYDDVDRWTANAQSLCTELYHISRSIPPPVSRARLLLTGAPLIWPNFKLLNIIEDTEATIAIDDLCSGTQYLYNPVEVDEWTEEKIIKAIATKYLLPSICPCFTESNDRIDRLLNLIREFNVDGIIYHSLRLCQLYDIEIYRIKQILKDKGVPVLVIHTDYSQEDVEQIKTRVEAFLEMLRKGGD